MVSCDLEPLPLEMFQDAATSLNWRISPTGHPQDRTNFQIRKRNSNRNRHASLKFYK